MNMTKDRVYIYLNAMRQFMSLYKRQFRPLSLKPQKYVFHFHFATKIGGHICEALQSMALM